MNYEKLGLAKGDHWGAKHVAHIDEGIAQLYEAIDNTATDAKFFDIDYDGIVSLKSKYRGGPTSEEFPYAVSDNGVGVDGSNINELPEKIVFPEVIDGTAVCGFRPGMFYYNYRVKEIVFPDGVTEIPASFCRNARLLTSIRNTEHITVLNQRAFMNTRIDKALFPNLTSTDQRVFLGCCLLHTADIGNTIDSIPESHFQTCLSLSLVKGGGNIKAIKKRSFYKTNNLKNLSFVSQLTSVGDEAFFLSRIQFDWSSIKDKCTFGTNATPVADNNTDYWSGVDFVPCENRLVSLFNQRNPKWADLQVGNMVGAPEGADKPLTYANGCSFVSICHIHSAITGNVYASPKGFEEWLISNGKSDLLNINTSQGLNAALFIQGLGYSATLYENVITKADFQEICDALARGAYVYATASTERNVNGGHSLVLYGINSIGEILFADSDSGSGSNLIYDNLFKYRMPLQNFTGPDSNFIVVEKKQAEE